MLSFICYDRCSTCQKAERWLREAGIDFVKRPIREQNPRFEELADWCGRFGIAPAKLFNTSGLKYKELGLNKEKLSAIPYEEQLRLLASDGMLVRRPLLDAGSCLLVGFKEKEWAEALLPQPALPVDPACPDTAAKTDAPAPAVLYLAAGCFWGAQAYLDTLPGVLSTQVGYANGPTPWPTYHEVCQSSGHAETVRVEYDPARLPLRELLEAYFLIIDPLAVNHQGGDRGVQYRTGIYWTDPAPRPAIETACAALSARLGAPLAVERGPLESFYPAERYHQKYLAKNPHGYCHIPASLLQKQ